MPVTGNRRSFLVPSGSGGTESLADPPVRLESKVLPPRVVPVPPSASGPGTGTTDLQGTQEPNELGVLSKHFVGSLGTRDVDGEAIENYREGRLRDTPTSLEERTGGTRIFIKVGRVPRGTR